MNKVDYFDIGGDPRQLMAYMVKNPGLIPGFESLTNGDINKKKTMLAEVKPFFWVFSSESSHPS